MQILRKELAVLVTGPVIAAQGACSFVVLSMRKGVLSEHHRALSLAHSHRGWLTRCMCVGPSQRENMRALAEYKPKGRLGLGWPMQECPIDGTQVPWLFPCFPDCSGPPSPTLCLRAHAHTLFLPPPCACYLLMVCHDPSILSNLPCQLLHAQHCLVQIPMRRNLAGLSTFHVRPLSWAAANL